MSPPEPSPSDPVPAAVVPAAPNHPVPPAAAAPPASRRRLWPRWLPAVLRWSGTALLLAVLLLAAAWLVLQWTILPRIDRWRPALEARATQALGAPVHIGAVRAVDGGAGWPWLRWARSIELRDVVVDAPATGAAAVRLPRVRAAVSPATLLPGWDGRWRLRFDQLLVDGAQLDARREADGRLVLAGFAIGDGGGTASGGGAEDWFFSQTEFAVRGGRVVWTDAQRGQPPVEFTQVDLVVRNGVRHHALRLDATPPADWGARWSVRGRFTQPLLSAAAHGRPASDAAGAAPPARLLARPGDWRRWRGTVFADLPAFDAASLRAHVALPLGWSDGRGALRAWVELRGAEPESFTADVALRGVRLQPEADAAPLAFERIDGRLAGRSDAQGGALQLQRLAVVTGDGVAWPAGDAGLQWRRGADGRIDGGALRAERLDLALLDDLIGRLPPRWLPDDAAATLAQWAPRGVVSGLDAGWDGAPGAPRHWRLRAAVRGFGVEPGLPGSSLPDAAGQSHPEPGRPGVERADLDLTASDAGGEARVAIRDGAMTFPGVFEQPQVPFDRLDGRLLWRTERNAAGGPPHVELRLRDLSFANADAQGDIDALWATGRPVASAAAAGASEPASASASAGATAAPQRLPGRLDLSGRIERADASRIARYLPLGVAADARSWVGRAVEAGRASASVRVRGDLHHFPFPAAGAATGDADDLFRVAVKADGVRLAYVPGPQGPDGQTAQPPWPVFTDVRGDVVFDRDAMELRNLQARLGTVGSGGLELAKVRGGIRRLGHDATLEIDGTGRGPLADALAFVRATPIDGWTGGALAQAVPAGAQQAPIELQLALAVPLAHSEASKVRGDLVLAGNDLRLRPELPLLGGARARVAFTERGFALTDGTARTLGGDAAFDAGQEPDGPLRVNVQGTATADGLQHAPELGVLARAADRLSGQTTYRIGYGVTHGQADWSLTSNLVGLAADLPVPLAKRAADALPLRVQAVPQRPAEPGAMPRDEVRVDLGTDGARLVQAHWLRELAPDGVRVLRGGIGVQDAAPQPADGVAAAVTVARLDADAWQAAVADWGLDGAAASRRATPAATGSATVAAVLSTAGAVPPAAGAGAGAGYAPGTLVLKTQELIGRGRRLSRVNAALSRGGGDAAEWRATVEATELAGSIAWRPADPRLPPAEAPGRLFARLKRLALPPSDGDDGQPDAVTSLLDDAPAGGVPALDIVADHFELRGKQLGRLEIQARNRQADAPGDATRGWTLQKFRLDAPDAQFAATGQWLSGDAATAGRPRAVMDFKLDVADGGALLTRLGQPEVVRGARGQIGGQVRWLGSPLAIDYPSLSGQVSIGFERGQFLQAEPGIAKLLGVLSLQSLPRRLLLDFRDVFERGFAFDTVSGDVSLAQGVASTGNLRMKGVQAVVLMEGRADVGRESQDLRVWVVPEFNTGAASLAVAAINPAVGLGSFLAQWLLRRPIVEAGTREFHVSGPWAAPQVDRIERRARDTPPSEDAPPPALPPLFPAASQPAVPSQ